MAPYRENPPGRSVKESLSLCECSESENPGGGGLMEVIFNGGYLRLVVTWEEMEHNQRILEVVTEVHLKVATVRY